MHAPPTPISARSTLIASWPATRSPRSNDLMQSLAKRPCVDIGFTAADAFCLLSRLLAQAT